MQSNTQPYASLKVLLAVMCALLALGGALLFLATRPLLTGVMHLGLDHPVEFGWLVFIFKALGAVALFVSFLLYHAARDPARNVAIIDGVALLLILASVVDIFAVTVMHFGLFYPTWAILARIVVRLALAFALIALRPKTAGT